MDHHHAPEPDLLRDLAASAILRNSLENAVLGVEFGACHHPG